MIIRIVKRGESKLWILAGLIVGFGLLTKLSGALISFALISPVIYWNATNS